MSDTKINYPKIGKKYSHYKGGEYEVITMATHSETQEKLVIYKSVLFGDIYARPLSIWNEKVKFNNDIVERFTLIIPEAPYELFDFKVKRISKNMSLKEVELATGISNSYLSQLETGKIKKPSWSVVKKLTDLYN